MRQYSIWSILPRAPLGVLGGIVALAMMLAPWAPVSAQEWQEGDASDAPHKEQVEWLEQNPPPITEDQLEIEALDHAGLLHPLKAKREKAAPGDTEISLSSLAATPSISDKFIVFAYLQSEAVISHLHWQSLTHVGSLFVSFDSSGTITNPNTFLNRSSHYKAGGTAQAAGVKVHIVFLNSGFSNAVTESVMTNAGNRTNLVNGIVGLINTEKTQIGNAPGYVHGVSFDFEPFSWSSSARDGMIIFFQQLRAALDAIDPTLEISWYVDPTPSSTQFNVPAMHPYIDFFTYSAYDYASGNTPHAISDFNNYINSINNFYLGGGLPPEKMVVTLSSYGRRWSNTTAYNVAGTDPSSRGWTDGRYDTTLNTLFGGPYTHNYVTGDESAWYTYNDGINRVAVWEGLQGWEYKIRHALSNQDVGGNYNGRRLGGVGFWSTYWFAEPSSYNMNTSANVSRTRTYPYGYQLVQEILAEPGTTRYIIDKFEGLNPRWTDPNESPDTSGDTDNDSSRGIVSKPGGSGAPANSTNAMEVNFDFEAGSGNQLFFRHEILATQILTSVPDKNAPIALLERNSKVSAYLYSQAAYTGREIRMVVMDRDGELEKSPAFTLNATGWRYLEWDLTNPAQIVAHATNEEGPFNDGDGTIDSTTGQRDIGFIGFLISGGAAGSGTIVLDEIGWERVNPGGLNYKINEFRYDAVASEFVEIYGPAGAFPANTELRIYNPANGSVLKTIALSGSIPNDGGGFGYWVVGDPGVPNVDSTTGFGAGTDDIPNTDPSAMQIYNTATGNVYDSLVYEAWGGLDDLIRLETRGVTGEGWPWLGQTASGTNAGGTPYTHGRYPDGADTQVNNKDFTFLPASPGAPNGGSLTLPVTFNFTAVPASPFKTFTTFSVQDPTASGLPASPSGGNAHRCVDTAGGGVMSVFGDKALGGGSGYTATGEVYIPSASANAQAIGLGIAVNHGSNFFTPAPSASGYEDGYWIIFENRAGVGLNDGRPDHGGTFEFVHATHDNMDGNPVALLANATAASLGVTQGAWTTFSMTIDPDAALAANQLIVSINGNEIYHGPLPAGGPTAGAFALGFRENHTGAPLADEGTWIDNLSIATAGSPPPTPTPTPTPTITATPTPSPSPTPSGSGELVENFEGEAIGDEVMFRDPQFSGSTVGINTATDVSEVSNQQTNTILDPNYGAPGTLSHRFFWEWAAAGTGTVRATTFNVVNRGNPIINLTTGVSVYVKITQGEVDLSLWVRETGVVGNIGDNGGATGNIERTSTLRRLTASSDWQYIYFNLPSEAWTTVTGNGVLDGTWGTIEALTFYAVGSSPATTIEIFVDDIYNGPIHTPLSPTPTPTPSPTPTPTPTPSSGIVVIPQTTASAPAPSNSDNLNGILATTISGGFHTSNTNPADQRAAFTDGAGLGALTGLLMDFPNENTPAWSGFWDLGNAAADLTEIQVFSGNTGKDGRVWHHYDVYTTTDPVPAAGSTWTPLISEVIPAAFGATNAAGAIEACRTQIIDAMGGSLIAGVTGLRLDFFAVSDTTGLFMDDWDTGLGDDRDGLPSAFESPLIYEVDAWFQLQTGVTDWRLH